MLVKFESCAAEPTIPTGVATNFGRALLQALIKCLQLFKERDFHWTILLILRRKVRPF